MLTRTASIGQAVLKSAIGLRKNYKETITTASINLNAAGCKHCHEFIASGAVCCDQDHFPFSEACNTCSQCVTGNKTKTIYVNEKNKYGIRHELKKNALLLFIYLHFLNPDKAGLVYINIEDAAEILSCTERTIKNNLRLLDRHRYITLSKTPEYPGYYKLFIAEYPQYFKSADEGGRGYCIIPDGHLKALAALPDINSLRLAIRNLIPETVFSKEHHTEKPYVEVQRDLPTYCSKREIKKIVTTDKFRNMFDVRPKKYFVQIKARPEFDVTNIAMTYRGECREKVMDLIETLRSESDKKKIRNKITLLEEDLDDICGIALKIPIIYILEAIKHINAQYILPGLPVKSIGALVRFIADDLYQFAA